VELAGLEPATSWVRSSARRELSGVERHEMASDYGRLDAATDDFGRLCGC
jgi:hypothetical protein